MRTELPVAEQMVPTEVSARVRKSLMDATREAAPRYRLPVGWVAATVIGLLAVTGVLGVMVGNRSDADLVAAPAPLPPVSTSHDQTVTTDLGPLPAADTDATLATCRRAADPALATVVSARRLTDGHAPFTWVAYRNVDDQIVICSNRQNGPTLGGERQFRPTTDYPVVAVGGMTSASWLPDQSTSDPTTATNYSTAQFFAASPAVATVQLRVIVDGTPGVWFTGKVNNGFVLVPVFHPGMVPLNANGEPQVQYERRAFDRTGLPVRIKS